MSETRPESPQVNPSGVPTNPEGVEHGSNALGHASGAFPDVRLLPDDLLAPAAAELWALLHNGRRPDGFWDGESQRYYELVVSLFVSWLQQRYSGTERMVPVGPLLELVDRWRRARNMHREHALTVTEDDDRPDWDDDVMALEYELRAAELGRLLASLLGETTTGEGS